MVWDAPYPHKAHGRHSRSVRPPEGAYLALIAHPSIDPTFNQSYYVLHTSQINRRTMCPKSHICSGTAVWWFGGAAALVQGAGNWGAVGERRKRPTSGG